MDLFQKINSARETLELPERATMPEIRANYKRLLNLWHPDKCSGDIELCNEMTGKITAAYRIIIDYCNHYSFSFSEEEISNYLSEDELWRQQFGNEPLWGKPREPE